MLRVYELSTKTMVGPNDPRINDLINSPEDTRYVMESSGFTDVDGTEIYEADIVNYQGQYYAVHKIGGEFVMCDEHGDRITPDWSQIEIVETIFDHRIGA